MRSGAAVVEFALILPFFMTLLMGIIEFGRVFMVEQIITNAAREGGRNAVLPGSSVTSARSAVTTYLTNSGINLSNATSQVTISPDPSTATSGSSITVTITVPFSQVSYVPIYWFMEGKSLGASVVMRKESNNT